MSSSTEKSLAGGFMRGLIVTCATYPLEVLKTRQQCSEASQGALRIASKILKEEGIGAFSKGLVPQLLKKALKQTWCWAVITEVPARLKPYSHPNYQVQTATALSIATIDAMGTTPLERLAKRAAATGKSDFSLKEMYQNGWRGFSAHWFKLSINWMTMLNAQHYLRERALAKASDRELSLPQLTLIGTQTALLVSLTAPFDKANTLNQVKDIKLSQFFSRSHVRKFYREWPLYTLSLMVHNVATAILIDNLAVKKVDS